MVAGPYLPAFGAAAGGKTLIEICSGDGFKVVAIDSEGEDSGDHAQTGPHCPFCLVRVGAALPVSDTLLAPPHRVRVPQAPLPSAAFSLPHSPRAPQLLPRPPPTFS